MARRGPKRLLPSPLAVGPEAVPAPIRDEGKCATGDYLDVFDAAFDGNRIDEARSVCAACPVASLCLEYAISNEASGVWGGSTPLERAEMRPADLMFDPEERRRSQELRVEIASGRLHEHIAREYQVNVRTLARWVVQDVSRTRAA